MMKRRDGTTPTTGGEFELIAELFAPLAAGYAGAFGLLDDAAVIDREPGLDLVTTNDVIVAGIHFTMDETPGRIAKKLIRVNLSDLAAMGARPSYYLLGAAFPKAIGPDWLRAFAAGLAEDQLDYGITLAGGDTVATDGPLSLSLTAFGQVAEGQAIRRKGAVPGQHLYLSGTVGDAALGLRVVLGELTGLSPTHSDFLEDRFRLPRPRTALGPELIGLATGAIDVSDGLAADLGHICKASSVGAVIDAARLPLSESASIALDREPELLKTVLSGGDDYELLFTVDPSRGPEIDRLSRRLGLPLTRIGEITKGRGVIVRDLSNQPMDFVYQGYTHFR
ncbi:MAG: thiamine-phosphate kinase [Sphingomonadales bacterium]